MLKKASNLFHGVRESRFHLLKFSMLLDSKISFKIYLVFVKMFKFKIDFLKKLIYND